MPWIQTVLVETWASLAEMAPYLMLGFLVAGLLSVFVPPEVVERHLGGRGLWAIIKASLFGIPLPLCSCGVIPVGVSLRRHGASRGATTSFLISTPQTGVDSILVTYSLLGPLLAVVRPIAALVSGLLGGTAVSLLEREDRTGVEAPDDEAPSCSDDCCSDEAASRGRLYRALRYGFVTLPEDIAQALIIGLLLAGVIAAVVPNDFFMNYLGTGLGAMLAMMVIGVPLYVCATGSVPIAAALLLKGISPGAALVFLMTGPATNAATISTIWKVLGRKTALVYLASVCLTALGTGALLDLMVSKLAAREMLGHGAMLPSWVNQLFAVALVGVLGYALYSRRRPAKQETETTMNPPATLTLKIEGMTCNHCAGSVQRTLAQAPGVTRAEVDLSAAQARVQGEDLDVEELCARVRSLGYEASPA
ncbi:MAG: SO_0444 family Cu/Zn efflux transporter [Acidobacteriota bacterium]|nr:SO_0444 family Cu/Zn efflux transporter [Acidobacteriota bacterium]